MRVLVADDNEVNRLFAVRSLERRGWRVDAVNDGHQVLAALDASDDLPYDAILMDVQMPGLDGCETTRSIRQRERGSGRRLTIIATTALRDEDDFRRCLEAGMDAYLNKPVRPEVLVDLLGGGDQAGAFPQRVRSVETPDVGSREFEAGLARLLELHARDVTTVRSVVSAFLELCPALLARVARGLAERRPAEVALAAQELRGASLGVLAESLIRETGVLERHCQERTRAPGPEAFPGLEAAWHVDRAGLTRVLMALG